MEAQHFPSSVAAACHSGGHVRWRRNRVACPEMGLSTVLWDCSPSVLTSFHTFQNPKRRVLPSNSSVSSVAGWTLPTSSSVPSASVPWLVQKGEWPQPPPPCCAQPLPFPQDRTLASCSCVPPPFSCRSAKKPGVWSVQPLIPLACLEAAACY